MKALLFSSVALIVSGCMTLSGTYWVTARAKPGQELKGHTKVLAEGSSIYMTRNALCINNPGATIIITDTETGKELAGESPYKCP